MRTVTLSTGERLEVRQAPLAALGPLISAFAVMREASRRGEAAHRAGRNALATHVAPYTDRTPDQLAIIFASVLDMLAVFIAVTGNPEPTFIPPPYVFGKGIIL